VYGGEEPKFDKEQVERLKRLYLADEKDRVKEARAFEAGACIRQGDFSRKPLEMIYEWKTRGRGKGWLARNSDEEICDALRLAVMAETERAAVAVLKGLQGVDVPVASAILTAIDQERYTAIDFRALEALGVKIPLPTINDYLEYLAYCREQAREWKVPLRDLDRALWQWSKEQSGKSGKNSV
jgi:hypothetical protein